MMPEAGARSSFAVGVGGEAGGGGAERNRGQAGTAARLAGGHVVAGACERLANLESCWRGGCLPKGYL